MTPLPELSTVVDAVSVAGTIASRLGPRGVSQKKDGSYVTHADREIGQALRTRLTALCPTATHLDEEAGGEVGEELAWVVDPIDGTTNFFRGDDRWCVSVALLRAGRPVLGVVHHPPSGATWAAAPNERAFVPDGPRTTGLLLGGRLPRSGPGWVRLLRGLQGARHVRMQGAVALDLVDVALGRATTALIFGASLWDYAAGWCLVEAVGGTVQRHASRDRWDLIVRGPTEVEGAASKT